MDLEKNRKADETDDTVELEKVSGLGALLKDEREKKGLNHEQMAQITKLRVHALEALENEAWHLLPPPVFVKGFIKSYARALGLGESRLIDLYQKTISNDTASFPQMVSPPKRTRKGLIFVAIALFGFLAFSLSLWMGEPSRKPATDQPGKESPSKILQRIDKKAKPMLPGSRPEDQVKEPEVALTLEGSSTPDLENVREDSLEPLQLEEKAAEVSLTTPVTSSSAVTESFVLTGRVHSETYVKIYVDDRAPKEYMFRPGSRPQWQANKGFYVMVGNASGIEFDLNGKVYRNLGKEGDVVHLRLPEDFKRQILEE